MQSRRFKSIIIVWAEPKLNIPFQMFFDEDFYMSLHEGEKKFKVWSTVFLV